MCLRCSPNLGAAMQCDTAPCAERDRKCLERLNCVLTTASLDPTTTTSSRGRCAGVISMNSTSAVDVRTGVVSIVQEFEEACGLFQKWRKGRAGKKAVGQEECETSLHQGKTTIEETFNRHSRQHGARFDSGDRKSLESIIIIRKKFRDAVGDVMTSSVAETDGKLIQIYPIALRQASEATTKDTVSTMDELSTRIITETAGHFRVTDPGDVLPPMPLLPLRPPRPPGVSQSSSLPPAASAASSQTSLEIRASRATSDNPVYQSGSASSSKTWLGIPLAPNSQRNNIYSPASGWKLPQIEDREDSSRSLVTASSSRSALNWIFQPKVVHPYHDITPLEPTPFIVPSFKCDEGSDSILNEGEAAVQRLWAAANNTMAEERPQSYPHSAPLIQGPWASIWQDDPEPRPRTPLLCERETTPPMPEETFSSLFLSPVRPGNRPASAQAGKRVRSEPMLEFSTPVPRFRRHVSGPSDARGE